MSWGCWDKASHFIQCSHTLPRIKFPTFSWLYGPHSLLILYEIVLKSFYLQRTFQNIGYERTWFSNNLVLSVVTYHTFCFWIELYCLHLWKDEIHYIFLTFLPISQPFLTLSANSQPFQGFNNINLISDFFKSVPTCGNSVYYLLTWWVSLITFSSESLLSNNLFHSSCSLWFVLKIKVNPFYM